MTFNPGWRSGRWQAICTKCGIEKNQDSFAIHTGNGKPRKQCRECCNSRASEIRDQQQVLEYSRKYRTENYELCLQRNRTWREHNLKYDAFRASSYRARKQHQTPSWSDLNKIKGIYLNCPEGHHVDHIIPLKGKLVSGLHVPENLQYLLARDNKAKRNLYVV